MMLMNAMVSWIKHLDNSVDMFLKKLKAIHTHIHRDNRNLFTYRSSNTTNFCS